MQHPMEHAVALLRQGMNQAQIRTILKKDGKCKLPVAMRLYRQAVQKRNSEREKMTTTTEVLNYGHDGTDQFTSDFQSLSNEEARKIEEQFLLSEIEGNLGVFCPNKNCRSLFGGNEPLPRRSYSGILEQIEAEKAHQAIADGHLVPVTCKDQLTVGMDVVWRRGSYAGDECTLTDHHPNSGDEYYATKIMDTGTFSEETEVWTLRCSNDAEWRVRSLPDLTQDNQVGSKYNGDDIQVVRSNAGPGGKWLELANGA